MVKLVKELYGVYEPYEQFLNVNNDSLITLFYNIYDKLPKDRKGRLTFKNGQSIDLSNNKINTLKALSAIASMVPQYKSFACMHAIYVGINRCIGKTCNLDTSIVPSVSYELNEILKELDRNG